MHPVLFSLANVPFSTFGVFMVLGFIAGAFTIWRLAKIYDLNEEKVFDLIFISFFCAVVFSRLIFIILSWPIYNSLEKALLINKYPGFSFWGGVAGGIFTVRFFAKRLKIPFWKFFDLAAVGVLLGLGLGNIGCFLGGCSVGEPSNLPIATNVVGFIGKRFPAALLEALLLLLAYLYLRKQAARFHIDGVLTSSFLLILGLVKFLTYQFKENTLFLPVLKLPVGLVISVLLVVSGISLFYLRTKRKPLKDIKSFLQVIYSKKRQKILLLTIRKNWYNHKINLSIKLQKVRQDISKLPRRLNVKLTPTNHP